VDPRLLVTALRRACERNGVRHVAARADCVLTAGGRVAGVRLDGGGELAAATVVIAAGVESARLTEGIEALPLRPVKGQLLVLRTQDGMPLLQQTVRGLAHGFAVYLVPRTDGRVIVGATVEERGHDTTVTADAMYTLLRDARRLVPGITELELLEFRAGLRPGTPDNAPVIGPGAVPGMVWATGHYRNGILLTPVTADAVVALLRYGELPEVAAPFLSARFARSRGKVIS
jgi:glycine oxidase